MKKSNSGGPVLLNSPEALFRELPLRKGMRVSFHHHLRMGDGVTETILRSLTRARVKDLVLSVSSILGPACAAAAEAVTAGTVREIETTGLKSPLSEMVLRGELEEPVIFRSHGGRARALREGTIPVDVAFVAAARADRQGNLTGTGGRNPFGSLGYGMADARYARTVVGVTDSISDTPLQRISIPGERVDYLLTVDSIGDSKVMAGGSLRSTAQPLHRLIAQKTAALLRALGVIKNGWSYQAGSGAASLLVTRFLAQYMREQGIKGSFASGGITGDLVELLEEGLFEKLYDVQSFDLKAAGSLEKHPHHSEMSSNLYADPGVPDHIASRLDVMILSATEVDAEFNVNSLTGTNGKILGALGGAPDTAEGSRLTVVVLPAVRGSIPTLHPRVRTLCTPGKHVDAVVTERGIAVNPRREDLHRVLRDSGLMEPLEIRSMESLIEEVRRITGLPEYPPRTGRPVGIVEDRHGSVLDTLSMVSEESSRSLE